MSALLTLAALAVLDVRERATQVGVILVTVLGTTAWQMFGLGWLFREGKEGDLP